MSQKKPVKSEDSTIRFAVCVKVDRYLDALSQFLNEGHMFIKHRLQTEDFLSSREK